MEQAVTQQAAVIDIAVAARACWPRFAALTAPEGAELLELQSAGVGHAALASLYPFDFNAHLPLIFAHLAASPALVAIFLTPELEEALSLLGFGITAVKFYHLQPVVHECARIRFATLDGRITRAIAAVWWAYALAYVSDRALLTSYPVDHPELVAAAATVFAAVTSAVGTQAFDPARV